MWVATSYDNVNSLFDEEKPVIIFKHSYRCSISSMALNRIENIGGEINKKAKFILIDVINQRDLSISISEYFNIKHESPQIIFYHKNEVQFADSHLNIKSSKVLDYL